MVWNSTHWSDTVSKNKRGQSKKGNIFADSKLLPHAGDPDRIDGRTGICAGNE